MRFREGGEGESSPDCGISVGRYNEGLPLLHVTTMEGSGTWRRTRAVGCVECTAVSDTWEQILEALEATRVVIRSKGKNGGGPSKALGPAL
jgi:hypothetical protein